MSLLRDIQNAADDSNTDVATLLHKCKVLAVHLGSEEFKRWVDHELNGYDRIEDLPEYRILDTESYGILPAHSVVTCKMLLSPVVPAKEA